VHVHGTGFVRTLAALGSALPRTTTIVVQHHGEPPGPWHNRIRHRALRGRVDGWLFTGADHGQADPFRTAGVIRRDALVSEVLEAGSLLSQSARPVGLVGDPAVLWVGRLIESKDPLTAIHAFGLAADRVAGAHLHLLATDRTLEASVRASIASLGAASSHVHVWDPVDHAAMPGWYAGADVLLSTSRLEGSNYSLIEAMTEGCTPVVTDLPSHRSIVGAMAPMFAPGDARGAAELLVRTALTDRQAVRAWAGEHLSWAAVVEQLVGIYQEVLRPSGT
jgi:glycosyltransferase involved in cell wall biosynthesis